MAALLSKLKILEPTETLLPTDKPESGPATKIESRDLSSTLSVIEIIRSTDHSKEELPSEALSVRNNISYQLKSTIVKRKYTNVICIFIFILFNAAFLLYGAIGTITVYQK